MFTNLSHFIFLKSNLHHKPRIFKDKFSFLIKKWKKLLKTKKHCSLVVGFCGYESLVIFSQNLNNFFQIYIKHKKFPFFPFFWVPTMQKVSQKKHWDTFHFSLRDLSILSIQPCNKYLKILKGLKDKPFSNILILPIFSGPKNGT
jgi:hypothetical protein